MKRAIFWMVMLSLFAADVDARGRSSGRSSGSSGSVRVDGYYRKDGTYVDSYTRSSPSPAPPSVFTGYTPTVPSSSTLSAEAAPVASPVNNTGRNLLLASAALGFGFFGWLKFQHRSQPVPPAPPETLEQRLARLWERLSDQQKQQIQDFKQAHVKEFLSSIELHTAIEEFLTQIESSA